MTLFGESAGSHDTCLQVVSPGSRGLFHRAISQSGGCTTRHPTAAEAEYLAALESRYGDLADEIAAVYPTANFSSPRAALARVVGDSSLVCGTYDSLRRAAAGGAPVYLYNFARPIPLAILEPLMLGATHGAEIAYVFGSVSPPEDMDLMLGLAMQGYWTRFARSGDPNGDGAVQWPLYADATDQRLDLDAEISVTAAFRRPECEFWWDVYDAEFD